MLISYPTQFSLQYVSSLGPVQVLFWDADAGDVCTGLVCTNDPFLRQLSVQVLGHEIDAACDSRFVAYGLLRIHRAVLDQSTADAGEDEAGNDDDPEPAPRPKKTKAPRKEPAKEVDMATLIDCNEDERVTLTYVPCVNGILKAGSVVLYGGHEFQVDSLVYDGRRRKAFAMLTATDDEVCMSFPNNNVHEFWVHR